MSRKQTRSFLYVFVFLFVFNNSCVSNTQEVIIPISKVTPTKAMPFWSPQFSTDCLQILTQPPKDIDLKGSWLIGNEQGYSTIALSNFEKKPLLSRDFIGSATVNRLSQIAFIETDDSLNKTRLIVIDNTGKELMSLNWESSWDNILKWVENDKLLIKKTEENSFLLLNITTRERVDLYLPFVSEVRERGGAGDIFANFLSFDNRFKKALYENHERVFVLRELNRNNILWAQPGYRPWQYPVWSPDGTWFTFVRGFGTDNLYLIDSFGFAEYSLLDFDYLYNDPIRALISGLSWSPDSKSFSFILKIIKKTHLPEEYQEYDEDRLIVVTNIHNHNEEYEDSSASLTLKDIHVIDYCNLKTDETIWGYLIWSPDSNYALLDGVLIDFQKKLAYKITDENVIEWLK